jgi:photosystem II stability/assembly factor-like uncharacterized protein
MKLMRRNSILLSLIILLFNCCTKKIDLNFTTLSVQAPFALNGIAVLNKDTIAVCGGTRYGEGDVYISYDGGKSWQSHAAISPKALYKIRFEDAQHIITVGYDGKVMISSDYGQTWMYHQLDYIPLEDLSILPSHQMITCGGGGYQYGVVFRLKDDGTLLQKDTFKNELRSCVFQDSLNGYCCGYGIVIKTTDGGKTWANTSASGDFFKSAKYDNNHNIYALGMLSTLIYSNNGGSSWNSEISGDALFQTNLFMNSLVLAPGYGVICGDNGKVKFKNGSKWEDVKSAPDIGFNDVAIVNNQAWLTGSDGKIYCMQLP